MYVLDWTKMKQVQIIMRKEVTIRQGGPFQNRYRQWDNYNTLESAKTQSKTVILRTQKVFIMWSINALKENLRGIIIA